MVFFFNFDADGGDLALVPYQQQNQLTVPDTENVLAPLPISIIVPSDKQNPSMASTMRVRTRTPRSSLVSFSHPFNFTLPETCVQFLLTMEPKVKLQFEAIRHLKQSCWLSLPERLTGWQVEKRQRHNGIIDKFYYHPTIKLRSEAQVKFYIKYGFVPNRKPARGKRSREEVSSKEPTTTDIVGTLLSHTEKTLLQNCNNTANIHAVDRIIAGQLHWTKAAASPPPAGITEPVEVVENFGASNSSSMQNEEEEQQQQIDAALQDQLFLLEERAYNQIESDYAIMEPIVGGFQTFFLNSAGDITEEAPPAGYGDQPRANAEVLENVGAPSINQNQEAAQIPALQDDQLLDLQLADEDGFDDLFRDDPIMFGFGPLLLPF